MDCSWTGHGGISSVAPNEGHATQLLIHPGGNLRCVYGEAINLAELGQLSIRRGSHVEPDEHGHWLCDLSPVAGPMLGPFASRRAALAAEVDWLNTHWLS